MLKLLIHTLSGILGFLLLYVGLFLSKGEEDTIYNRLEEFWIRVDDMKSAALTRQAAFLREIANVLGRYLDEIFGRKLFSPKTMVVSLWLSLMSYALCGILLASPKLPLISQFLGVVLILLLAMYIPRQGGMAALPLLPILLILLVLLPIFSVLLLVTRQWKILAEMADVYGLYGGMILSDILFLAANRWALRKSSDMTSAFRISLVFLTNVLLACALLLPLWVSRHGEWTSPPCSFQMFLKEQCKLDMLHQSIVTIGASNVMTAAIALFLVLLTLVALVHRLLWPLLARPVMAAERHGLIEQHKLLVGVGCACLIFAWPNNIIVQAITKLLRIGG